MSIDLAVGVRLFFRGLCPLSLGQVEATRAFYVYTEGWGDSGSGDTSTRKIRVACVVVAGAVMDNVSSGLGADTTSWA